MKNKLIVFTLVILFCGMADCFAQQASTNRALSLDGNGDYVSIPSSPALQNPGEITIEAWINPTPTPNNQFGSFFNKGDGLSSLSARTIEGRWFPNGNLSFAFFLDHVDGAPDAAELSAPVVADEWTHIAASLNSAQGIVRLFTNGLVAAETTSLTGTPLRGRTLRQSSLPLVFGWTPSFDNTHASGYLDDIRVWNKARSSVEVQCDFHRKLSGLEPNLVGFWTFDDGTANDHTTNGFNGAFFGDATTVADATAATNEIAHAVEIFFPTGFPTSAYQLQYTTDVNSTNWINLGDPINGNGQEQSLFDRTRDAAKRFYRVISY